MIGPQYWSIGIIVRAESSIKDSTRLWGAHLKYLDSGFVDDDASIPRISTEGLLQTRYSVAPTGDQTDGDVLRAIIDTLIADANRLGIVFRASGGPSIYYHSDGEDPDHEAPPNWRDLVREQNERLGWQHCYANESVQEGRSR
jgi:hypothetical protein